MSVGNQSQGIELSLETADISSLADDEMISKTLEALRKDQFHRRPFSPAEALNVLTVGGIHADASEWNRADRRIDLLKGARTSQALSAQLPVVLIVPSNQTSSSRAAGSSICRGPVTKLRRSSPWRPQRGRPGCVSLPRAFAQWS